MPSVTTNNVNVAVEDNLLSSIEAVDDLVATLRHYAGMGTVMTIAEIVTELMPPSGRRATRYHCKMIATSLAILLQRKTFMS